MMIVRIDCGAATFKEGCDTTEFYILKDELQMVRFYVETLHDNGYEYILYFDGVPVKWNLCEVSNA